MMAALRAIFCPHKWAVAMHGNVYRNVDNKTVGIYHVLQCEKCGNVKTQSGRF